MKNTFCGVRDAALFTLWNYNDTQENELVCLNLTHSWNEGSQSVLKVKTWARSTGTVWAAEILSFLLKTNSEGRIEWWVCHEIN